MNAPWMKFYPSDWRQDPQLRMCSMGARGLWIEMIALMHQANPYGHLLVSGQSPTDAQLAMLVGSTSDEVTQLLGELESAGVFSRTRTNAIYSRKMTRMQKKAATARNNGRKGGNPSLGEQKEKSALDNLGDKPPDKPQKLEARNQSYSDTDVSDGQAVNQPLDFTKEVFDRGVAFLGKYGTPEPRARSLIGKWRKDAGDAETFNALKDASRDGVSEPVAWITARLKPKPPTNLEFNISEFEDYG